ncbi:MAG: SIS domain-containing protein [Candidatus Sericytochromatia bacterium]|nr:SIS domain-containing protein [Candidatus Sericytochromatia bacterium]
MSHAISQKRSGHPYWMYDTLLTQPDVAETLLRDGWEQATTAAETLAGCDRLFLVGIGSSLHVAQAGAGWVTHLAGIDVQAVPSLEFCLYGPALRPGDGVIVISHSGGGGYTREALILAQQAGVPVVTLTGQESAMPPATVSLTTSRPEVCRCHTAGYSGALIVMIQVATALTEHMGVPLPDGWHGQLQGIPAMMTAQLGQEPDLRAWATEMPRTGNVIVVGAGIHQATASEVALKMQEAVQRQVQAMTIEQLAHGPMAALQDGDLVLTVIPENALAVERQHQVAKGLAALNIPIWGISSGARRLGPSPLPEWFSPLSHLVPMQLLTYWWAVAMGVDPDWNRLDQPAHAAAKAHY